MSYMHIRSANFPNVHVRLDGTGVTHPTDDGGGTVNCQYGAGPYETYTMINNADGTVSFQSMPFPNVFLRMDGRGVTQPRDNGSGIVNAQYTAGPYEKFILVTNDDGTSSLKASVFDNVFLRIDGSGVVSPVGPGAGVVNCQFGAGPYESLAICNSLTDDQVNAAIDRFVQAFPQQAAQINSNRQRIINACCPPFTSTAPDEFIKPAHSSFRLAGAAADLNPCDTAIRDVSLDVLGLVLSCAGLNFSGNVRQAVYQRVAASELESLRLEVQGLRTAWNQGRRAAATKVFSLIQKIWEVTDIFNMVWDAYYDEMDWWDWIVSGVKASAMIASWLLSDGLALIAEIVLLIFGLIDLGNHLVDAGRNCHFADEAMA